MLNKLAAFIRQYDMIAPGDRVICAVSGGADSVAMLFAMYLLREQLEITLEAAHFNHQLRGGESDEDETFVRAVCDRYDIPLHVGSARVSPGEKGLEAAAREARYAFLRTLPGKIATAHTADDNAETVLMHLIRGTGLKGLGGITPVSGDLIRPMLSITREDVEDFLDEYCLTCRNDSSNAADLFLRNRLRHHVMPVLAGENPRLARSVSAMALRLRQDEALIASMLPRQMPGVEEIRAMHPALRSRLLERFLKEGGVREPEQSHIALAEQLVFSPKPSARADLPGGVTITRNYDRLEVLTQLPPLEPRILEESLELPELGLKVICTPAERIVNTADTFTVFTRGSITIRCRQAGDAIRLAAGTKPLKKLFIDRKIPAHRRLQIPVAADEDGILGVWGVGANLERIPDRLPATTIHFKRITEERENGG